MKALPYNISRDVSVKDVPPKIKQLTDVLVRIISTSAYGYDLRMYKGQ